jgi:hypothetical protein
MKKEILSPLYTCLMGGRPHRAYLARYRGYAIIYCRRHGFIIHCTHTLEKGSVRDLGDKEYTYLRKMTEDRIKGKITEDGA